MRDRVVNAAVTAEAKRERDAIDEAAYKLFSAIRWARQDKNHLAAQAYKYAVSRAIRLFREHAPDANKLVSFIETGVPPLRRNPGPPAKTLRNLLIADIIEDIRRRGFDPHRGDATKDKDAAIKEKRVRQSACSIVAMAWRELADGKTPPKRLEEGFAPIRAGSTKVLSESSLERIWDQSE